MAGNVPGRRTFVVSNSIAVSIQFSALWVPDFKLVTKSTSLFEIFCVLLFYSFPFSFGSRGRFPFYPPLVSILSLHYIWFNSFLLFSVAFWVCSSMEFSSCSLSVLPELFMLVFTISRAMPVFHLLLLSRFCRIFDSPCILTFMGTKKKEKRRQEKKKAQDGAMLFARKATARKAFISWTRLPRRQ